MYRWTLGDVVLVLVFLIACFGAGVMLKTMHEIERMADENHAESHPDGINLNGAEP